MSPQAPEPGRVLITGGAGFIGANLAVGLASRHPDWKITALDNLKRRGAELNLRRLRSADVDFVHGDVRILDDLLGSGEVGALVECSAEPTATAGLHGSPDYVVQSNLMGAYNCLELARRRNAYILFLSTSRVYPVRALEALTIEETETRFELAPDQQLSGASAAGVTEDFPLAGARTIYGTTKLAAEMLIEEYRATYGLRGVINRCGVVAGPWQMGKVDQGVFTHWMLAHYFGHDLRYIGFEGSGRQVRDLLHVDDLLDLIDEQLLDPERWDGVTVNVGGGRGCSLSLREATQMCAEITGRAMTIGIEPQPRFADIPVYLSDCARLATITDWRPRRDAGAILRDIYGWIVDHETAVRSALQFVPMD